jgi:hypothetical protein
VGKFWRKDDKAERKARKVAEAQAAQFAREEAEAKRVSDINAAVRLERRMTTGTRLGSSLGGGGLGGRGDNALTDILGLLGSSNSTADRKLGGGI